MDTIDFAEAAAKVARRLWPKLTGSADKEASEIDFINRLLDAAFESPDVYVC